MLARILLVAAAVTVAACGITREDFHSLDLAGREIVIALGSNPSPARLTELRGRFTTALDAAAPLANSGAERDLIADYRAAQAALDDLLAIVALRERVGGELLPVSEPLAERAWKTYDLPINTNEPPSIYATEAVREIQSALRTRLTGASDRLGG